MGTHKQIEPFFIKVKWSLKDNSHPDFNLWINKTAGYLETFKKDENPNFTKPFGQQSTEK